MLLKVKVAPGHRYDELPLRMADGSKVYITKDRLYTVIDTEKLAEGEEFTIHRYVQEGRFLVKDVPPEPELETEEPDPENAEKPTYHLDAETGILTHAMR